MNELVKIRKFVTITEEVLHDGGPHGQGPRRCAAVLAVVANPYAGRFEPDILPMMEALKPLGLEMSQRLIDALGLRAQGGVVRCSMVHYNTMDEVDRLIKGLDEVI